MGYGLYSLLRDLVPRHQNIADTHGLELLRAEQHLGVAFEATLNRWLAARPELSHIATYWYSDAHFAVTIGLLFATAKIANGRRWRLAWYATTAIALLTFWLFPTAPPRLLPHSGFLDVVAALPTVGSVSDPAVMRLSNQYAAMPSLHVAWAVWAAAIIWRLTRTRPGDSVGPTVARGFARVLAVCYPVATGWVVLATANHYLADVLAGVLTTVVAFAMTGSTAHAVLQSSCVRWTSRRYDGPPRQSHPTSILARTRATRNQEEPQ